MAASIGGRTLFSLKGLVPTAGTVLEEISDPHVAGHAYRRGGPRAEVRMLTSIEMVANDAAIQTAIDAYKALQATLVTVVDDFGNSRSNVAVIAVANESAKRLVAAVGGNDRVVTAYWLVQKSGA